MLKNKKCMAIMLAVAMLTQIPVFAADADTDVGDTGSVVISEEPADDSAGESSKDSSLDDKGSEDKSLDDSSDEDLGEKQEDGASTVTPPASSNVVDDSGKVEDSDKVEHPDKVDDSDKTGDKKDDNSDVPDTSGGVSDPGELGGSTVEPSDSVGSTVTPQPSEGNGNSGSAETPGSTVIEIPVGDASQGSNQISGNQNSGNQNSGNHAGDGNVVTTPDYSKVESVDYKDVLDRIDFNTIASYTMNGVTKSITGETLEKFETDFKIDVRNREFSTKPVEIENTGTVDLLVYANGFKHISPNAPRVVSPDTFADWDSLDEQDTAAHIAMGIQVAYSDVSFADSDVVDYWYPNEMQQERTLIAKVAPGEKAYLNLVSKYGLKWTDSLDMSYNSTVVVEPDQEAYDRIVKNEVRKEVLTKALESLSLTKEDIVAILEGKDIPTKINTVEDISLEGKTITVPNLLEVNSITHMSSEDAEDTNQKSDNQNSSNSTDLINKSNLDKNTVTSIESGTLEFERMD